MGSPKTASPAGDDLALPTSADDDVLLARAALAGDASAMERLAQRLACVPRILYVLNSRLGAQLNEHDLADLTQDTILLLWGRLPGYNNAARLETWAYGHARWAYMNALRKKARRGAHVEAREVEEHVALGESGAQALDGSEILDVLDEIGADEARVIRMKVLEDRSFDEIAVLEGISANTLKARYYRGIGKLSTKLRARRWDAVNR